jgi:phosphatidylglycerol lysyltransferase
MDSSVLLKGVAPSHRSEARIPSLSRFARRDIARIAPAQTFSFERRLSYLRQHGTFTLAYSATVQEGLQYFGNDNGFIAYKMVGRTAFALGDPVTSPEHREMIIRAFVKEKSDVCFCQTSRSTAELLAAMGFKVNELGTDTRIDLTNYKRKSLRSALKRATNNGHVIKECAAASVGVAAIEHVSDCWRQTRTYKDREVGFINRPIVLGDEVDVRKFYAFDPDGKLVAFAFFDPVYRDGQVIGYSTSFKRRLPNSDPFINGAVLQAAIDAFRREGRTWLHLGLAPLADVEDKDFRHSRALSWGFRKAFASALFNRFVYPLQGHALHKREYRGVAEQTYFAFNQALVFPRTFKLLRACNMI